MQTKSTRRLAATIAAVATVAFAAAAAAPSVSSAQAMGGCPEWMCGSNHNEVMATPSAR